MKKLSVFFIFLLILTFLIPNNIVYADNVEYYLGGIPAGFTITERGAKILDTCYVATTDGLKSPAIDAGLQKNDIILYINNIEVNDSKEISENIDKKNNVYMQIKRNNEIFYINIEPVLDIYGKSKLGVILKENQNGIGTITYFSNNSFGSLGHAILNDEKEEINIYNGKVYLAQITGVVKGERGKAGELRGIFFNDKEIGNITKNVSQGTFGTLSENYDILEYKKIELGEAKIGEATICTTISGCKPKEYSIQIVKADGLFFGEKNLVIKITSEELLKQTNGIVQGMSGSPIIQDGKLVGAVTHVFINDPTRGYGIKIQDMINN